MAPLLHRAAIMTDRSLASSVPQVDHWRGQPGVWLGIRLCWGRRQPNYRPSGRLVSRRPPYYRCPRSSAFFSTTQTTSTCSSQRLHGGLSLSLSSISQVLWYGHPNPN